MLACTAMLVGCSDDDIIQNDNEKQEIGGEKINATLTLSISSSNNSSRAETGGDSDGTTEDSNHHNQGTTDENKVTEALLVLSGPDPQIAVLTNPTPGSDGTYSHTFTLGQAGTYKAIVVLNPSSGLNAVINSKNGNEAYEAILNYRYDYTAQEGVNGIEANIAAVSEMIGANKDHFMMANVAEEEITITANNADNIPVLEVEVERVVSKITFRAKKQTNASLPHDGVNCYPVEVKSTSYMAVINEGGAWLHENNQYTYVEIINKAYVDSSSDEVWVTSVVKEGTPEIKIYKKVADNPSTTDVNEGKWTGKVTLADNTTSDKTADKFEPYTIPTGKTYTLVRQNAGTESTTTWYVALDKYALVNLSTSIWAVRHTNSSTTDLGSGTVPFGTLHSTSNPYLVDPFTDEKSDWNETASTTTTGKWFNSYIGDVQSAQVTLADEQNTTEFDKYFTDLPGTVVENENHNPSQIGDLMAYCFENSVLATAQKIGVTTGIIFRGQIYKADGSLVNQLYYYNNKYFLTIQDLKDENPNDAKVIALNNNSTEKNIEDAGITIYKNGYCYYYAAKIKHYEDGNDDVVIPMEHAIMRNNIYSLAIEHIGEIGDATVNLNPAGLVAGDLQARLTLKARILPWIVRFNNINF